MISNKYLNDNPKYKTIYNATHPKFGPIALLMAKDPDIPMHYKVVYGASTVVFKTYNEAISFIKSRFKNDSKSKYYPLVEVDNGIYSPLFPFDNEKQGINFEFYLERIDSHSYLLHRGKATGNEPKTINCPLCGRTLNKITNKAMTKYTCFACSND